MLPWACGRFLRQGNREKTKPMETVEAVRAAIVKVCEETPYSVAANAEGSCKTKPNGLADQSVGKPHLTWRSVVAPCKTKPTGRPSKAESHV
jgi:hypothetical protein